MGPSFFFSRGLDFSQWHLFIFPFLFAYRLAPLFIFHSFEVSASSSWTFSAVNPPPLLFDFSSFPGHCVGYLAQRVRSTRDERLLSPRSSPLSPDPTIKFPWPLVHLLRNELGLERNGFPPPSSAGIVESAPPPDEATQRGLSFFFFSLLP